MVQLKQAKIDEMLSGSKKWAYWIVGILLVGGISYILFNRMNKQVAGLLVFLAGMLALYFYYVKWFVVGTDIWPPFTGMCPDFLTQIAVNSPDTGKIYCVDTVGVSTNGGLAALTNDQKATLASGGKLDKTAPGVIAFSTNQADMNTNCASAATAGLAWISLCGK